MAEITRSLIARVGVDLSKRVVQVHAVDRAGRVVLARPVSVERSSRGAPSCPRAAWLSVVFQ